jgi:hypothetical protein
MVAMMTSAEENGDGNVRGGAWYRRLTEGDDNGRLRMTVEVYGYKYLIEGAEDMNIDQLFGRVIVPLVLNMGYHEDSVARLFVDGLPTHWDSAYGD